MNDAAKKTNLELSHDVIAMSNRVAALDERVTVNADHIATELGKLEARAQSTSDVLEALSSDFLNSHNGLSDQFSSLEALVNRLATPPEPKPTHAERFKALIAAQLEINNATLNVDNDFTKKKYADLASVMDAVRIPLANNGLTIIQLTDDPGEGVLGIRTMLVHESGQTIEDHITMSPEKFTPQGVGSCRTYMRRYAVLAICAIAGAIDDDGEGAQKDPNDYPRISTSEAESIIYHADETLGDRADEVVRRMLMGVFGGINAVGDIREGEAAAAIQAIDNAKKLIDKKAKTAEKKETAEKREADESK